MNRDSILKHLDKYVIGQEEAKKALATAGFLHVSKAVYHKVSRDPSKVVTKPSNALIMGPSGQGKTFITQTMSDYLGLPYLEINARTLTKSGYIGMSIEDCLADFIIGQPRELDDLIPYSIIFLDEFDKICYGDKDNWDVTVQQSLLKYLEGSVTELEHERKHIHLDTRNFLWILGGNFAHLRERLRVSRPSIGFNNASVEAKLKSTHEELIKSGVLQEVAGRISIVAEVKELTRAQLKEALLNTQSSVYRKYQDLFQIVYGKELELSRYYIDKIVNSCCDKGIGARGLAAAMDEFIIEHIGECSVDLSLLRFSSAFLRP